jgi:hypothetical protein
MEGGFRVESEIRREYEWPGINLLGPGGLERMMFISLLLFNIRFESS